MIWKDKVSKTMQSLPKMDEIEFNQILGSADELLDVPFSLNDIEASKY